MTDKVEQISNEVKRLLNEPAPSHDSQCKWEDGYWCALYKIEEFIDSIQEVPCDHCQGSNDKEKCDELVFGYNCPIVKKPASNDLEEAAFDYAEACKYEGGDKLLCVEHFKAGAEWSKKTSSRERFGTDLGGHERVIYHLYRS